MTRSHFQSSTALAQERLNAIDVSKLALQIVYRPTGSLAIPERHLRKHSQKQIDAIAANVREHGFLNPVLIDEHGTVIDGVARLLAARQLDLPETATIMVTHLSRQQIKRINVTLNSMANMTEWDMELLAIRLNEIISVEPETIPQLGFELPQIDFMLGQLNPAPAKEDPADAEVAPPAVPVSRPGDLWTLGHHRMLCASSLAPESWVRVMAGRTAAMAFADGPYNVKISGHVSGTGKHAEFAMASGEMTGMEFVGFNTIWLNNVKAHSADGAVIFACMDWRHDYELQCAGREAGLALINICIWDKGSGGMGSLWRSQYELVLVFKHGKAKHTNNVMLGKHGRNRTNVWCYPGANSAGETRKQLESHPTPKPVQLVADAILDVSNRGEIVVDPFLGSGTTILAAERTGRIGYGIEIAPGYVDVGITRWQDMTGREAVLEATGETFAQVKARRAAEALVPTPDPYAHINPPRRRPLAA